MSSNRRAVGFWIRTWLPVLLAILMIVAESTEWMGADHTSGPLRAIWQAIFGQNPGQNSNDNSQGWWT